MRMSTLDERFAAARAALGDDPDQETLEVIETQERLARAQEAAAAVPPTAVADLPSPLTLEAVGEAVSGHLGDLAKDVVPHAVELVAGAERTRRQVHERQTAHRLFWVATYHDGTVVDERDAPGEISSESIDRKGLKHLAMVEEDGTPHAVLDADGNDLGGLDFPKGDDPKLVYRRRSWVQAPNMGIPQEEWLGANADAPWEWTYLVGYHHKDGRIEMWGMGADGVFRPEPEPDLTAEQLVPVEQF